MAKLKVEPDTVVDLRAGETVLAGLYRHGYAYRIGCRRGGCGICKVDLVCGAVRYESAVSDDVLTDEERQTGTCLTCRAIPAGDITIALREEQLRRNPMLAYLASASSNRKTPTQHPQTQGEQEP